MQKITLFSLLFGLVITANGTPLSGSEKKDFIESGFASCFSEQRKNPENKEVKDHELKNYCYCYVTKSAELITHEDLMLTVEKNTVAHMQAALSAASAYCVKKAVLEEYNASHH